MGKQVNYRAVAVLTLGLLMFAGLSAFAQSGSIRELSGTVELKSSGAANYVAAKVGDSVRGDTVISTGFKSTALVELGSALVVVRPLTRLTLTEIQAASGTENINLSLQTGRVRVDLNPPAGTKASMTVSSPSATASVRGTSFDFDTRNLRVHHGTVAFAGSRGQSMLVRAGSDSRVADNGKAANPLDVKTAALLPPAPVGTDTSPGAGTVSDPARSRGSVDVGIVY